MVMKISNNEKNWLEIVSLLNATQLKWFFFVVSLLSTQTTSTDSFQMDEEVIYGTGYEEIPITDSAGSSSTFVNFF